MTLCKKSSELMWLFGIIFVALGVSICNSADLGVSMIAAPAFVISEALCGLSSFFSVGVTEYLIQGVLLILLSVIVGRFNWRYLLPFCVAVIYGYTLDLFLWILSDLTISLVLVRWLLLIVGDLVTAFGVACFFRTYMPLQAYELFVSELSTHFSFSVGKTKWAFDMSMLVISIVFSVTLFGDVLSFDWSEIYSTSFHSIGLGTLVTTVINSPLIVLMGKLIDRLFVGGAMFPRLEKILKID